MFSIKGKKLVFFSGKRPMVLNDTESQSSKSNLCSNGITEFTSWQMDPVEISIVLYFHINIEIFMGYQCATDVTKSSWKYFKRNIGKGTLTFSDGWLFTIHSHIKFVYGNGDQFGVYGMVMLDEMKRTKIVTNFMFFVLFDHACVFFCVD